VSLVQGGERRTLARGILGGVRTIRPAWSPDSRWVSYCEYGMFSPRNLFVANARTGQARQVTHFVGSSEGIDRHAWLPDGRHIIVSYVAGAANRRLTTSVCSTSKTVPSTA